MILPDGQQKPVFHQFEFVKKFNFGNSKPQEGTSILSVSAGLFWAGSRLESENRGRKA